MQTRLRDPSSGQTQNAVKQYFKIEVDQSTTIPTPPTAFSQDPLITMSRFFRGDSSSESSSSDEEELYSDDEEVTAKVASEVEDSDEEEDEDESSSEDEDGAKKSGANRFMRDAESESEDSSEDERSKTVKSAKDKRIEELETIIKAIENGQKINDWGSISTGMLSRAKLWTS